MRILKFLLLSTAFLFLITVLTLGVGATATPRQISFMSENVSVATTDTTTAGTLTVPDYIPADGSLPVGWQATVQDKTVFLPVGATYTYEADAYAVFRPVTLQMTTASAVTARFADDTMGLRFTTAVKLADWQTLLDMGITPQRGTLIVPRSYVIDMGGVLTHEKLAEVEKQYLDVVTDGWYSEGETEAAFAGSVSDIRFENYTRTYAAVGYVKITYTNGETAYIYATLEGGKHLSRSPWQTAYAALGDVKETADETYCHSNGQAYSPYSTEERLTLSLIMAPVIVLELDESIAGNKTLASGMEVFGQRSYTQTLIKEGDEGWLDILRLVGIKATGALVITATDGTVLDETTVAGVVINLPTAKGIAMSYVLGDNCVLISYSDYSENY